MKSPIRKGDKLEHGGEVTGKCSPWIIFMGRPLARKGDEAACDLHGPTVIDEEAAKFADRDKKLFALHDHRCACGCRLISSLQGSELFLIRIKCQRGRAPLAISHVYVDFAPQTQLETRILRI